MDHLNHLNQVLQVLSSNQLVANMKTHLVGNLFHTWVKLSHLTAFQWTRRSQQLCIGQSLIQ